MSIRLSRTATKDLHGLLQHGSTGSWTDGQLVAQFLSDGEVREAAFRALVVRHGPMVLGVCRRILNDPHAAEDAFQTTFLVLVKKAGTLRDRELLTNWLYGVAHRVARRSKVDAMKRRTVESRVPGMTEREGDLDRAELRAVIDEEISRLPEQFRVPLVLCHLEGLQHQEVARRLGCPVGTVESRLSRARERLRSRLARRGLAPTAGMLAWALTPSEGSAALYPLVESTVQAAISAASRGAGSRACTVLTLLRSLLELKTMASSMAGLAAIIVISAGFAVVGRDVDLDEKSPVPKPDREGNPLQAIATASKRVVSLPVTSAERGGTPADSRRLPSAIASPLKGIVIDGDLKDWPDGLTSYPIRKRLRDNEAWDPGTPDQRRDFKASFKVGYGRENGLIYVAVTVQDPDVVVDEGQVGRTDAAEIYIDGSFSERKIPYPTKDWKSALSGTTMPVLQYVGIPASVPAYGDRKGANPALMYDDIAKTATTMAHRHSSGVTTYEWAVQAFDRYPDRPTALLPGKSLGFEVAIVDHDRDRKRPAFTTWGDPPRGFKGFDASQLGKLYLASGP